ncbi:recombinase RecT [Aminobacter ciceronei]|uniref:Recombination protein RecT n=1 Tax=Aminobacter ciceronei TaxID=150723 RepID=A0ABR6C0R2_9HYPH|nr:recombinase RecT [Aminobacter ciceronei]MBA8904889.1 recombination protein RecT [Aminobacter ciceronei]MBA9018557.1 recombination protein RecT [Aminobacter ciceronei]
MSQALATQDNRLTSLKTQIARMQGEFGKALPGHITAERFVRTAQTAIALTRNIDKVRDPQSLLAACSKAAADGLILDGREAALVVDHNGEVQYRPMMRGLLKLAYNSGKIKSLVVEVVRDADFFDYQPTRAAEPLIHKIDLKSKRGDIYAVYALATLIDGGILHEVMTLEDVNRIRDRSDAWKAFQAKKIKSTPWHTDWSEMARKTAFRRLSKYLPSSSERDTFHQAVERIDEDYSHEIEAEAAPADPLPATKKRGAAAAALKDITPQSRAQEPAEDEPPHDRETGEIVEYDGPDQQPGDDI